MSSTSSPTINSTKNSSLASAITPQFAQTQSGTSTSSESYSQRRSGSSGSFGAGSISRTGTAAPRNGQAARKQNRNQRRPKLIQEDTMEAVSFAFDFRTRIEANHDQATMRSLGTRKGQTNITHLMNFSMPPRPQNDQHGPYGRTARRNPTWGLGSGYHAVDKARCALLEFC